MKIVVCVKHVPDTAASITIIKEAGFDDSVKFVPNPFDEYALEEAVQTAQKEGGEVVVVCVGKEDASDTIRSALAVGADRGILVKNDALFPDSAAVSRLLKAAIEKDGQPDLIFTGKQSVDTEGAQTHYRLAGAFGMPVASEVVDFTLENGKAVVECEADNGERDVIELTLPCVIGAAKGLNEPRYPKLPDIMKAGKKEIQTIAAADLIPEPLVDKAALIRLKTIPERGEARMLEGTVHEQVETLVRLLKEENKVL